MNSNNPFYRNQPRSPNNPQLNRHQMEIEQPSLFFKPIQKVNSDDQSMKSIIIELQNNIRCQLNSIFSINIQDKLQLLEKKLIKLQKLFQQNIVSDQDQILKNFDDQKNLYQTGFNNIKTLQDIYNLLNSDIHKFLKRFSSFEISYSECKCLEQLEQDLINLDMIICILDPQVQQYKEVLFYEQNISKITKYTKNQVRSTQQISISQIQKLAGLLNKFYKFRAIPNKQERYLSYYKFTPDLNLNHLGHYNEIILILYYGELNTYALLFVQQQQNQRICKSISIGKMRSQILQFIQQFDCTTFTPTLVPELNPQIVLSELLKIVAPQINLHYLIQFLEEDDYWIKEDKNETRESNDNYFVDLFEMERLGFSL